MYCYLVFGRFLKKESIVEKEGVNISLLDFDLGLIGVFVLGLGLGLIGVFVLGFGLTNVFRLVVLFGLGGFKSSPQTFLAM